MSSLFQFNGHHSDSPAEQRRYLWGMRLSGQPRAAESVEERQRTRAFLKGLCPGIRLHDDPPEDNPLDDGIRGGEAGGA